MLTIIDYGVGNLRSVYMAFQRLGVEPTVTSEAQEICQAQAVVLPGVGAFGDSINSLRAMDLEQTILDVIEDGIPFLGICVGLQLLFEVGEEMGEHRGLGILPGRVRRFSSDLVVPHMGWNQIQQKRHIPLFRGLPDGSYAYFVHSYYVDPEDDDVVAATTDYGINYASVVARDNLYAIQFHPEKSQDVGERILTNFLGEAGMLGETAC